VPHHQQPDAGGQTLELGGELVLDTGCLDRQECQGRLVDRDLE